MICENYRFERSIWPVAFRLGDLLKFNGDRMPYISFTCGSAFDDSHKTNSKVSKARANP